MDMEIGAAFSVHSRKAKENPTIKFEKVDERRTQNRNKQNFPFACKNYSCNDVHVVRVLAAGWEAHGEQLFAQYSVTGTAMPCHLLLILTHTYFIEDNAHSY